MFRDGGSRQDELSWQGKEPANVDDRGLLSRIGNRLVFTLQFIRMNDLETVEPLYAHKSAIHFPTIMHHGPVLNRSNT